MAFGAEIGITGFIFAVTGSILLSLSALILYVVKILGYKYDWEHYPDYKFTADDVFTGISVVIAFRNEAVNLDALFAALKNQNYPKNKFEVILIDDHSTDGSGTLAESFCNANTNFILIQNQYEETGKKIALLNGINKASNELIVTTDADCTMTPDWLATISGFYREKDPDMIIGLVDIVTGPGFFEKFEEIEFLSLIAAGAGAAAGNNAIYCNAACLAFKKSLYHSLNDPLQHAIVSGDDTLFLHRAKNQKRHILLLKSAAAIVVTRGVSTWRGFFNQRSRWVSKSRHYRDAGILYTSFLVLLINLLLIIAFILCVTGSNFWLFPVMYVLKTTADLLFMRSFLTFYGKRVSLSRFTGYAMVYPFYVVFFAIGGLFSGYTWKGRQYHSA